MPSERPSKIVTEYEVTLPGIEPENRLVFRVWVSADKKWRGEVVIPPHTFRYESNSETGMLQKAKEELLKRYPGATFSHLTGKPSIW
jgi:hypothetical protein